VTPDEVTEVAAFVVTIGVNASVVKLDTALVTLLVAEFDATTT
jgi:hypothetical protein